VKNDENSRADSKKTMPLKQATVSEGSVSVDLRRFRVIQIFVKLNNETA